MQDAVATLKRLHQADPKPWLIVGKGPTSDKVSEVNLSNYHVFTLNQACTLARPLVAHFIDIEPCIECLEGLMMSAHVLRPDLPFYLCMPWYPHEKCAVTSRTLESWLKKYEALQPEQLLVYNSTTAGKLPRHAAFTSVFVRYFSAVAAFNLLAGAGVRQIATLGVDGGCGYGQSFDLSDRLKNTRKSYDDQTREIKKTVAKYKIEWIKLYAE